MKYFVRILKIIIFGFAFTANFLWFIIGLIWMMNNLAVELLILIFFFSIMFLKDIDK